MIVQQRSAITKNHFALWSKTRMHQKETNEEDIGWVLTKVVQKSDRARTSRSSKYVTIERVRQWTRLQKETKAKSKFPWSSHFLFSLQFDDRYVATESSENKQEARQPNFPPNISCWVRNEAAEWCVDTNFRLTENRKPKRTKVTKTVPAVRNDTTPLLGLG